MPERALFDPGLGVVKDPTERPSYGRVTLMLANTFEGTVPEMFAETLVVPGDGELAVAAKLTVAPPLVAPLLIQLTRSVLQRNDAIRSLAGDAFCGCWNVRVLPLREMAEMPLLGVPGLVPK